MTVVSADGHSVEGKAGRGKTSGLSIPAQPTEKENVDKSRKERQDPRKHLRKPRGIKTVHIAGLRGGACFRRRISTCKLDRQRDLSISRPKPVSHRDRKQGQYQRKEGYLAVLPGYGLGVLQLNSLSKNLRNPAGLMKRR